MNGEKAFLYNKDQFSLTDQMENGVVIVKNTATGFQIVYANPMFCQTVGQSMEELIANKVLLEDLVAKADREKFLRIAKNCSSAKDTYRLINASGNTEWHIASHKYIQDGELLLIIFASVQEIMVIQRELRESNAQLLKVINSIPVGLLVLRAENGSFTALAVNELLVNFSNDVGSRIDGKARNWTALELEAILTRDVYAFTEEEDIPKVAKMLEDAKKNMFSSCTFRLRGSAQKSPIWIRSNTSYGRDDNNRDLYHVTYANVTTEVQGIEALRKNHERMRLLSFYDPLTGVRSRNAYNELLANSEDQKMTEVGFIFSDINGLKNMNDTSGHQFGDKMICEYVSLLRQVFENEDIYRISGDEFLVIVIGIDRGAFKEKVSHINQLIKESGGIASLGYFWEERPAKFTDAIYKAEQFMYLEKQHYYATESDRESKHHKNLVNRMVETIKNGQFVMYLQPKAEIGGKRIIGAEALVRKKEASGQLKYPEEFISLLEKEMIISNLDYYMFEEACKTLKRWREEGRACIKISVNISRVTIAENDFIEKILEISDKYNTNRELLELEITESTATLDLDRLKEAVAALRDEGFSVSLDDMGTDYSALRMLLIDGIDTVKLDKSFIAQNVTQRGKTLLGQMINMFHELGLNCIAEGVETDEQRLELMEMGCEMYQGYLLAKPIPVEEFERLVSIS